jgi:hypothetical protein
VLKSADVVTFSDVVGVPDVAEVPDVAGVPDAVGVPEMAGSLEVVGIPDVAGSPEVVGAFDKAKSDLGAPCPQVATTRPRARATPMAAGITRALPLRFPALKADFPSSRAGEAPAREGSCFSADSRMGRFSTARL